MAERLSLPRFAGILLGYSILIVAWLQTYPLHEIFASRQAYAIVTFILGIIPALYLSPRTSVEEFLPFALLQSSLFAIFISLSSIKTELMFVPTGTLVATSSFTPNGMFYASMFTFNVGFVYEVLARTDASPRLLYNYFVPIFIYHSFRFLGSLVAF